MPKKIQTKLPLQIPYKSLYIFDGRKTMNPLIIILKISFTQFSLPFPK